MPVEDRDQRLVHPDPVSAMRRQRIDSLPRDSPRGRWRGRGAGPRQVIAPRRKRRPACARTGADRICRGIRICLPGCVAHRRGRRRRKHALRGHVNGLSSGDERSHRRAVDPPPARRRAHAGDRARPRRRARPGARDSARGHGRALRGARGSSTTSRTELAQFLTSGVDEETHRGDRRPAARARRARRADRAPAAAAPRATSASIRAATASPPGIR